MMTHDEAVGLLSDFAARRLAPQEAARVDAHIASCRECREAVDMMRAIGTELAAHGDEIFADHPAADELSVFASDEGTQETAAVARIAVHLRACPTCAHEVSVARDAHARSASLWRRIQAAFDPLAAPLVWRPLAPALAVLVIALAFPAYYGVVELPEVRSRYSDARHEADAEGSRARELAGRLETTEESLRSIATWGGGARALLLPPSQRGGGDEMPIARFAAGQPHVPVLVEYNLGNPAVWPPERRIVLAIRRAADGASVWATESTALSLWDPITESMSILVPTNALAAGDYRFELTVPDSAAPIYSSSFRVAE